MTFQAELTRFLADHATAESRTAFASGVGPAPTAATLAAAMNAKGYRVSEAEVAAVLDSSKQSALGDEKLDAVVGGQGRDFSELEARMGKEKFDEFMKNLVKTMASDMMEEQTKATNRMKATRREFEGS